MFCVLVLAPEQIVRELACRLVQESRCEAVPAADEGEAVRAALAVRFAGLVVDTTLSGDVGGVCERLFGVSGRLPRLFLATPAAPWLPGVIPLDPALDEVVCKPLVADELSDAFERLMAKVRRERRRLRLSPDLHLDLEHRVLEGRAARVPLTDTEFRLLEYLTGREGEVVELPELLDAVWRFPPGTGSADVVRAHIKNLRRKLRELSPGLNLVHTVRGRGLRFSPR